VTEDHHDVPAAAGAETNDPKTERAAPGDSPPGSPQVALTPELLKSAYNAFKKRWKLTRLDQESRIGRGPLSSGQKSSVPPNQFPRAVWDELVKQGRLKYAGSGMYALP
jgi:hypothetical protein